MAKPAAQNILHLVSANVQGLRECAKRARFKQWALNQKANIIFIQESHFTADIVSSITRDFPDWYTCHSFGTNYSRGCSIFIHKSIDFKIINSIEDENGRFILLNLEVSDNQFTLINIYANNEMKYRNLLIKRLTSLIESDAVGIKLFGGDFNDTLTISDRITNSKKPKKCPANEVTSLIKKYNLTDIWRIKHPHEKQFTWRRKNGIERSRIDFWLLEENALPLVYTSDIRPIQINATDHMAIQWGTLITKSWGPCNLFPYICISLYPNTMNIMKCPYIGLDITNFLM